MIGMLAKLCVATAACCAGALSAAQDAPRPDSATVGKREPAKIANIDDCRPAYPRESLQADEWGNTVVRVRIAADGALMEAGVSRSSGHRRLDEATVQAMSRCKFLPGTVDGQPMESTTTISYRWRIEPPKNAVPCRPDYPAASFEANEQGTTVLRMWVSASGDVERGEVDKSSGFPRLDRAALLSLSTCRFQPLRSADGRPTAGPVRVEYVWRLVDDDSLAPAPRPWAPPTPDPYRPF